MNRPYGGETRFRHPGKGGWMLLAAFATLGCGTDAMLARIVHPEDDRFARAYIDSVRLGRADYAASLLAPALAAQPGIRDSIASLGRHLPAGALDSVHLVGANRFIAGSVDRLQTTYEFHSAAGWGVTSLTTATESGARYVEAFQVSQLAGSLEAENAFTLRGKSAGHYLMLAVTIACFAASLWGVILALRAPMRRRWLWALLALVGAGVISFNWTTGQVGVQVLHVQLLSAGFLRQGLVAPWILSAAFPIGALMVFAKVKAVRRAPPAQMPADPPISTPGTAAE